jgi:GntR family transcriptional regulator of abcA and norABC
MYKKDPLHSREEEIADKIREYIAENNMQQGDRIPAIKEFAKYFNAGKQTISGAIELLCIAGLLRSKTRSGVFVLGDSSTDFNERIDWGKVKKRSAHCHLNQKFRQHMNYMYAAGDDAIDLSLPHVLEDISGVIPKFSNLDSFITASTSSVSNSYFGQGLLVLREALCRYMASYGVDADPAQIVVLNSFREAAVFLGTILISNGTAVYYEEPGQLHPITYLHALGGVMRGIGTDGYGIKTEILIQSVRKEKSGILYTFPVYSMPTGITTSKTRKRDVLKITSRAEIPIIEMDLYRQLDFDAPSTYYSMDKNDGVIYVGSFNELFPLGLSLTWVVVPYKLLDLLKDLRSQLGGTVPYNIQMFISDMLNNGMFFKYLDDLKKHIKEASEFSGEILKKHFSGIAKWASVHPMLHWVELNFAGKILQVKDGSVRVMTGEIFSANHPNHIVISKVSPKRERYEEAIIALKELIKRFLQN